LVSHITSFPATLKNAWPVCGSEPNLGVSAGSRMRLAGSLLPKNDSVVQARVSGMGRPLRSSVWKPTEP